jgi:hypothetical protein
MTRYLRCEVHEGNILLLPDRSRLERHHFVTKLRV